MTGLLLRRAVAIPVTLFVVSLLVFLATEILPGDAARTVLGREASEASVARLRGSLGLDQPLSDRFLRWAGNFVRGDWGTSLTLHVPVRDLVFDRLGSSLLLAGFAFVLLVPVALAAGVLSGLHHDRPLDWVLSGLGLVFGAIPEFVTGVVLLVVFAVNVRWFPASAQTPSGASLVLRLEHLVLPALSLVLLCTGYVARHVRAGTVSVVDSTYVRAAELRGSTRWQVVRRHVLRNATVPAVSALGVQAQFLLGGLVAVELLFNYPGAGALLLTSALDKDLPTLQATAVVLGLCYVLIMTAVDLAYRLLDPRIRRGVAA
ncbi:ABC transporter permease [Amycolatopsis sp. cmx-8-4]|uniref:ABC transporter permease n=1 Tax=Amycolatopsis sp. cmx-8-4 TaxID=2790947 RepID=UPI00397E093D